MAFRLTIFSVVSAEALRRGQRRLETQSKSSPEELQLNVPEMLN